MSTRTKILWALLPGLSSSANAIYLSHSGVGEVLVYPYYTVNGGNTTLITIVNGAADGKALKVRFLEGYDPYVAKDRWLDFEVTSEGDGFAVFVQSDDLDTARGVLERAKRFAGARAR